SGGTVVGETKGIVNTIGAVIVSGGTVDGRGSNGVGIRTDVIIVDVNGPGPSIIKGTGMAVSYVPPDGEMPTTWGPKLGDGVLGQASMNYDGTDQEPYDADKIGSYKHLRFGTAEAAIGSTEYATVQWAVDA